MGKKKKGAVCNNPVAMARAAGPPPITGPTIRDYLGRDRPSLDEAAGIIASQHRRKESGTLAAYEDQLNETYKQELKERREKLLGGGGSTHTSRSKERKKKKKSKKSKKHKYRERSRSRSRSRSPLSTHPSDSDQCSDGQRRSRARHKKKHRHKHADQPVSRPSSSDEQQN